MRNFGLKVGVLGMVGFEARIKELVENLPDLAVLVDRCSLSGGRFASRSAFFMAIVRDDEVCWRA